MSKLTTIFGFILLILMAACSENNFEPLSMGGLRLSIEGVSVDVSETRSTPAEIGKPQASDFHLRVVRQSNGAVQYDGTFTTDKIDAAPDEYSITVDYGTNPIVGLDMPYYVGTATATVESTTEPTPVNVPVGVGNALVSAVFGTTEEETARFSRFFDSYAVNVSVGSNSASITNESPAKSVYVRAGSTVTLTFSGYYKPSEREVSMIITLPEDVSNTLSAADHLVLTLTMNDESESAVVTVTKAEVTKVNVEEKVSYNWLPRPIVSTEHKYVRGNLVGTDLNIGASFPDVTWQAQIHQGSASGNVVRTLTGEGTLSSTYTDETEWPYLPPGTYVATYRFRSSQGKWYNFSKTTTFTVPDANLTLTANAYTSYSKYEEGDIEAANACDRLTVYEPSAVFNVANNLLANENYTRTYEYTINGKSTTVPATNNAPVWTDITGIPVSANPYTFQVRATFCGQTVIGTKQVRIIGLPYTLNLRSHSEWSETGSVSWESNYVKIGGVTITTSTITCSDFSVPQTIEIYVNAYSSIKSATLDSNMTIQVGAGSATEENSDYDTTSTWTLSNQEWVMTTYAQKIVVTNGYQSLFGKNYSYLHSLSVTYR